MDMSNYFVACIPPRCGTWYNSTVDDSCQAPRVKKLLHSRIEDAASTCQRMITAPELSMLLMASCIDAAFPYRLGEYSSGLRVVVVFLVIPPGGPILLPGFAAPTGLLFTSTLRILGADGLPFSPDAGYGILQPDQSL